MSVPFGGVVLSRSQSWVTRCSRSEPPQLNRNKRLQRKRRVRRRQTYGAPCQGETCTSTYLPKPDATCSWFFLFESIEAAQSLTHSNLGIEMSNQFTNVCSPSPNPARQRINHSTVRSAEPLHHLNENCAG